MHPPDDNASMTKLFEIKGNLWPVVVFSVSLMALIAFTQWLRHDTPTPTHTTRILCSSADRVVSTASFDGVVTMICRAP